MQLELENLQDLSLGTSFLGSGGGGCPHYELDMIYHQCSKYPFPKIIQLSDLPADALILPVAFVGALLIHLERLPNGLEFEAVLSGFKKYYGKYPDAIAPGEIGGANGLTPFLFAGKHNIPIIDGDLLGRAYPRLEMSSANLAGIPPNPVFLGDVFGQFYLLDCNDPLKIEHVARHITVSSGSSMAIGMYGMSAKTARVGLIPGTVSKALSLGKLLRQENGLELLQQQEGVKYHTHGVITDVDYQIKSGFMQGKFIVQNDDGQEYTIFLQNEYLGLFSNETYQAITPDIISLLDADSLEPIASENLMYGSRVIVVSMRGPELWYSPRGLELVGPAVFDL